MNDIIMLNMNGDLIDLMPAVQQPSQRPNIFNMTMEQALQRIRDM